MHEHNLARGVTRANVSASRPHRVSKSVSITGIFPHGKLKESTKVRSHRMLSNRPSAPPSRPRRKALGERTWAVSRHSGPAPEPRRARRYRHAHAASLLVVWLLFYQELPSFAAAANEQQRRAVGRSSLGDGALLSSRWREAPRRREGRRGKRRLLFGMGWSLFESRAEGI